ncbi:hypothetical protein HPP92_020934 [Vanilla planifolia]|uniref:3-ketoacyl-CoA synthase n=1 Tax=Vanilla planifolia TaxID=51239 RepID=A0A835Q029_VANPL|nr:hypothetical protein HPP92_020934 [Vanilla planifolia]
MRVTFFPLYILHQRAVCSTLACFLLKTMESLQWDHFISSIFQLVQLLVVYVCIAIEIYVFVAKCGIGYYLLPVVIVVLLLGVSVILLYRRGEVYLLDFSCLRPPLTCRVPTAALLEHLTLIPCFDAKSVAFMSKIITASGIGEETYFPPSLHYIPPFNSHAVCLDEAHMLLFPTLDDLFAKTHVDPRDVDVLVVNCSGFCPAPSLSAMVVSRYVMREDVKSYSLSGMGCSAGAIGVDIARGAMRSGRARYAVVVSTEIVSTGWYPGKDRRKLLLNCLFRMGCSAVMLTNRGEERARSKYKLLRLLRTQRAFDDRAYRSAIREEDAEGITGFSIERDLLRVASETLRANVVELGASILPAEERLRYVVRSLLRAWKKGMEKGSTGGVDWGKAIQHFCLPASGIAVMEEIGKGLGLGERETEAARMTFHRFGNQSSSSIWYQLAYEEGKGSREAGECVAAGDG